MHNIHTVPGGEPVGEGAASDGAPAHGLRDDPVEGEPELRREHPQPRRRLAGDVRRPVVEHQAYPREHRRGLHPVQRPAPQLVRAKQPLHHHHLSTNNPSRVARVDLLASWLE